MDRKRQKPVLVTISAPTASGKSHILNYIRDVAQLPCIISTTTRPSRKGETEGVDYNFISEQESLALEQQDAFAELVIYNGVRYGVTKKEFHDKLNMGIAFLIVEPRGANEYAKPALDVGALHVKTFVFTPPQVRMQRFLDRAKQDVENLFDSSNSPKEAVQSLFSSYIKRLNAIHAQEYDWGDKQKWDVMLFGEHHPEQNLIAILREVKKRRGNI
jgi:guanylate kinase